MLAAGLKGIIQWGFYRVKRMDFPWVDFADQRSAVIARFHSVSEVARGNYLYVEPNISVSPKAFDQQIAFLAERYRCISMDDLLEALESGRPLPRNAAVVTFDDGYRDNYEFAYPILRRYRVPAIFYLATGCLDGGGPLWPSEVRYLLYAADGTKPLHTFTGQEYDISTRGNKETAIRELKARLVSLPRTEREEALKELRAVSKADLAFLRGKMLSWKEVKEMQRGGMDFGAHTVSHPLLPRMPLDEAREEIAASKAELETQVKKEIYHFSYPNPGGGVHCDLAVKRLVAESGYLTAVTSQQGYVRVGDDRLELRRVGVGPTPWGIPWYLEREALGKAFSLAH